MPGVDRVVCSLLCVHWSVHPFSHLPVCSADMAWVDSEPPPLCDVVQGEECHVGETCPWAIYELCDFGQVT